VVLLGWSLLRHVSYILLQLVPSVVVLYEKHAPVLAAWRRSSDVALPHGNWLIHLAVLALRLPLLTSYRPSIVGDLIWCRP
jgi:hypothetical protein